MTNQGMPTEPKELTRVKEVMLPKSEEPSWKSRATYIFQTLLNHFQCPVQWKPHPELLRKIQNVVQSMMNDLAQEFPDNPREFLELQSYAVGFHRQEWQQRCRVSEDLLNRIQGFQLTEHLVTQLVRWSKVLLQAEVRSSAEFSHILQVMEQVCQWPE
ncbi:hypothetical protein M405DRAFT_846838 [Rhizopogon salebrosus TDB-379]|nr:hypothetical protein M405DRAFT_846838 [Rhizopogon salebrosus TDB-379]